MKRFLLISIFLFYIIKINAQDRFERLSVNFGLTHPILNSNDYNENYIIDPEIEVLMNFRILNKTTLSTGFGMHYREHTRAKEVNEIVMVDSILRPWNFKYQWKLNFISIKLPVFITIPVNNSFLDSYVGGISLGWICKYDITKNTKPIESDIKLNRYYIDFSFGVRKELSQSDKLSVAISPILGYQTYFSEHNKWQKDCIFYQLKLIINFKPSQS